MVGVEDVFNDVDDAVEVDDVIMFMMLSDSDGDLVNVVKVIDGVGDVVVVEV